MKHLVSQTKKAQEPKWFNSDGWDSADSWNSADSWDSADAAPQAPRAPSRTSLPFIIQIANSCSATSYSNIDLGDSLSNRTGNTGTFTSGSLVYTAAPNVTISSLVSGITYLDFLGQSESQPFKVGRTLIIVTSGSAASQFAQGVTLTHREAGGVRHDEPIVGVIDPYQNQTDRYLYEGEYLFDGFTRIRFNAINASTTVVVYLYPAEKFAATQTVAGRNSKLNYANPHITRVNASNTAVRNRIG